MVINLNSKRRRAPVVQKNVADYQYIPQNMCGKYVVLHPPERSGQIINPGLVPVNWIVDDWQRLYGPRLAQAVSWLDCGEPYKRRRIVKP